MEHIIRPSTLEDVDNICLRLREEDAAEILAASGQYPMHVLPSCFDETTKVWTADNDYVALFGVNKDTRRYAGIPWMVATPLLEKYPIQFVKFSRQVISGWIEQYPYLINCVDARNELHVKWLKWAGFTFTKLHPEWGAAKIPFHQFEMQRRKEGI